MIVNRLKSAIGEVDEVGSLGVVSIAILTVAKVLTCEGIINPITGLVNSFSINGR